MAQALTQRGGIGTLDQTHGRRCGLSSFHRNALQPGSTGDRLLSVFAGGRSTGVGAVPVRCADPTKTPGPGRSVNYPRAGLQTHAGVGRGYGRYVPSLHGPSSGGLLVSLTPDLAPIKRVTPRDQLSSDMA